MGKSNNNLRKMLRGSSCWCLIPLSTASLMRCMIESSVSVMLPIHPIIDSNLHIIQKPALQHLKFKRITGNAGLFIVTGYLATTAIKFPGIADSWKPLSNIVSKSSILDVEGFLTQLC